MLVAVEAFVTNPESQKNQGSLTQAPLHSKSVAAARSTGPRLIPFSNPERFRDRQP